jgi:uncharacterized membrane protein
METMLAFGIFIGALLFILGLVTGWLAPRVGPNPFFGVRIGYAFASRAVWDRANRAGGMLLAAIGIVVVLLAFGLRLLFADATAMLVLTGAMLAMLIGAAVWLGFYARHLAQGTELARETAPVTFRWVYLAPILGTFALLAVVAIYFYPLLPADRIAMHFDFDGRPNDWMSRDGCILFFIGMGLFFIFINALVVLIATREPMIAFGRWGSHWRMEPGRGLFYTGIALGLANLILAYALFDIAWFSTRAAHFIPILAFLWLVFLLIPILIALFFVLGRRESERTNAP